MSETQGSNGGDTPDSLLPYEAWTEEAFRGVAIRALSYVAAHGLPGEHHFYITFRTDHPAASLPARLRAKYPEEMTIVLQHKYWDLIVDEAGHFMSVGLSFGGVASTLVVPFDAMTGFADPSVKWGLRFRAVMADSPVKPSGSTPRLVEVPAEPQVGKAEGEPQVVSLDAFRKRKD